jgi:hypothetical protein
MNMDDLSKLMGEMISAHNDFLAAHRETEHHVVRMMERQSDLEAMTRQMESLTKQVAENNIRLSRILEIHDYNIDELDARLKRLEDRRNIQ